MRPSQWTNHATAPASKKIASSAAIPNNWSMKMTFNDSSTPSPALAVDAILMVMRPDASPCTWCGAHWSALGMMHREGCQMWKAKQQLTALQQAVAEAKTAVKWLVRGDEHEWALNRREKDRVVYVERVGQRDGSFLYAVRSDGNCLAKDGVWEWEPMPSSRNEAFTARCRFATFDEAMAAARTPDPALPNGESQ